MIIKRIIDEDLSNYKCPSMLIAMPCCTFKCGKANCQNSPLFKEQNIQIRKEEIVSRYLKNNLTHAMILAGLEPFDSWNDLLELITEFRNYTNDDFVIYTGYTKCEIADKVKKLSQFKNVIIKFGRYIPGQKSHYDGVLGVELASDNQYAERIS